MKFITTPFTIEEIPELRKAGADALLISTPFFSARGVIEFEVADLPSIKEACTIHDVKMFVQVNRFFMEEELEQVRQHLQYLKDIQVDGIYFGDEGVLYLAKQLQMEDRMIYAPDTLLTNHKDVDFYLAQGLHSVVLAKEITFEEILKITKQSDAERLEVVIHGYLPMMHSKRQLLSNYMKFRKKDIDLHNKRSLYIMEETRDAHMPILEDEVGTHIFSGYIQCFFEEIKQLQEAGIGYVLIDGIFKDTAYIIDMLKLYHELLADTIEAEEAINRYHDCYPQDVIESGFLYTKTSKSK